MKTQSLKLPTMNRRPGTAGAGGTTLNPELPRFWARGAGSGSGSSNWGGGGLLVSSVLEVEIWAGKASGFGRVIWTYITCSSLYSAREVDLPQVPYPVLPKRLNLETSLNRSVRKLKPYRPQTLNPKP